MFAPALSVYVLTPPRIQGRYDKCIAHCFPKPFLGYLYSGLLLSSRIDSFGSYARRTVTNDVSPANNVVHFSEEYSKLAGDNY